MNAPLHNLYALFHQAFGHALDQVAIQPDEGRIWTYGDLHTQSARMANWLESQGLQPGDRVMVQVEKSVPTLVFYLACLRAGMVYVPLNTAYQSAELNHFIENAEPKVFVTDPAKLDSLREMTARLGVATVVTLGADGTGSLIDVVQTQPSEHAVRHGLADDLAAILYTSGTTGRSKGAQLTHGNLASNARTLHRIWAGRTAMC